MFEYVTCSRFYTSRVFVAEERRIRVANACKCTSKAVVHNDAAVAEAFDAAVNRLQDDGDATVERCVVSFEQHRLSDIRCKRLAQGIAQMDGTLVEVEKLDEGREAIPTALVHGRQDAQLVMLRFTKPE